MSELPHPDDCVIALGTEEHFHHFRDIIWPLWSPHQTLEQNRANRKIEKEEVYSQDHRHQSWVLVDRNHPDRAYTYLETLRRDGWSKDSEGKIEEVPTYAIVSVITPEQYRRKGYSRRLLRQLHYILASPSQIGGWPSSWGAPPDLAELRKHTPPTELTQLSSFAPPGFYEGALIGPDADGREAWLTRPEENVMLNWDFSSHLPLDPGPPPEWAWTFVYSPEYDSMAPALAEAHLRELRATKLKAGHKVFRVRPDSPGVLRYADLHMVFGMSLHRPITPGDKPTGIRWFRRPSYPTNNRTLPPFQSTDPLILFLVDGALAGELLIQMVLNISEDLAPMAIRILLTQTQRSYPEMTKLKAFCPPDDFRNELLIRGGLLQDRSKDGHVPHGTCFYGRHGSGWLINNEVWTWA